MLNPKRGINKITLPITPSQLSAYGDGGLSYILDNFSKVVGEHTLNRNKIDDLWNYYLGLQDIRNKIRRYDDVNNNKITENLAFAFVEIKTALFDGNKKQFSKKSSDGSDDITYLDRYLTDCGYYSRNIEADRFAIATGVGVTFTAPDPDVIAQEENNESPFIFNFLDPRWNFVVYSSGISSKPLFCVNIIDDTLVKSSSDRKYIVWTRDASFELNNSMKYIPGSFELSVTKHIPMVERSLNASRIGIIELLRDDFNLVNILVSNSADAVVDKANQLIVFQHVSMKEHSIKEMLEAGAVLIPPPADRMAVSDTKVYTLDVSFSFGELSNFFESRLTNMYAIAGIPLPSSNTTSGGDTGQAGEIRSGWETASIRNKMEANSLIESDYQQLKQFIEISRLMPGNKLNELSASEIDIKYVIKYNDNPLVRAQAFDYYMKYMPPEMALDKSGSSMDSHSEGLIIEDWMNKQAEKQIQETPEQSDEIISTSE